MNSQTSQKLIFGYENSMDMLRHELVRICIPGMIYCPVCEGIHENSTECQRDD